MLRPIFGAMVVLSIIRIYLGWAVGVWFPAAQLWDDALMMGYSDLAGHFLNPERYSLLKDMSFPVFLKISSVAHLPYSVTLALLWVVAGLVVFHAFYRIFNSSAFSLALFVYVLFMPQAFEIWCGTRLYRNAIIGPFVLITISLMINMLVGILREDKMSFKILNSVFLGIFFSFTYYIKEDGIWLMACLLFTFAVATIMALVKKKGTSICVKSIIRMMGVIISPLIIFIVISLGYKSVNYKFFGVFEVNTRTGGAYGEFVENIYKISASGRSMSVWTPAEAISKAFEASETLSQYPELLEAIYNTEWQGGSIVNNPIPGDHFNWILREEMNNVGIYYSEAWVEDFFTQVNRELDGAFKSGTLEKQDGVLQIVSSAGGYTGEEIASLKDIIVAGFRGAVVLDGYKLGLGNVGPEEITSYSSTIEYACGITHLTYLSDYSEFRLSSDKTVGLISPIIFIYKFLNTVLFAITILIIVYELVFIIINIKTVKTFLKNRCKIYIGVLGSFVFLGISFCYAAAISWFSAFLFTDGINMTILNFYNIALPGLLFFSYSFTVYSIREEIGLLVKRKGITQ